MHRPSISEILKKDESYYSLVVAVAKRAREIAIEAEETGEVLAEKPVQLAVEQFADGEYKLIETANIGVDIE
ncbi:DNA-directed RNA polymerase subunit omega [Paludicola sp. MB14-C6]|uniref:DNA-directed RNA polymerase subunit omega n=1 Tax=Paludihabitans sp. MB14-C6 TaxID=3070656 RepID=UPI0027DD625C|nr:DNA-directed RNA polymerase subunit omega [Paludicola sp. MB14-C6]WMJ22375.1 DNA-directed RNA polymerase subunit omega [Paludicola sp. MB14-C6]